MVLVLLMLVFAVVGVYVDGTAGVGDGGACGGVVCVPDVGDIADGCEVGGYGGCAVVAGLVVGIYCCCY